jgi:hypothetical protein
VFGPDAVLARHPVLKGSDAQWGRSAARIVTAWPKDAVTRAPAQSSILQADRHAIARNALVTWLMAPAIF